jgi:tetratricopeptide (TPR) repeat protein
MNSKFEKAKNLYMKEKYKQSLAIAQKINKVGKSKDCLTVQLEGLCYLALGLHSRAKDRLLRALFLSTDSTTHSMIFYNLYRTEKLNNDYLNAAEYLQKAIDTVPPNKKNEFRFKLAKLYFLMQEYQKSVKLCKALIVYSDYTVKCTFLLIDNAVSFSDIDSLHFYLSQLEARMKGLTQQDVHSLVSSVSFFTDRDISSLIIKAIDVGAEQNTIYTLYANNLLIKNQIKLAAEYIRQVDVGKVIEKGLQKMFHETNAKIYEKNKEYDLAFTHLNMMNEIANNELDYNWRNIDYLPKFVNLGKFVREPTYSKTPKKIAFLVGFPRSGTTLLENILDSQTNIISVSEKPMIRDIVKKIISDGNKYPECILDLNDDYREELRSYYFNYVARYTNDSEVNDKILIVDKNPLEIMRLPLLKALFPEAKIIVALRHPLDCILSCYKQNFQTTTQLAFSTELKTTFDRYREIFSLYNKYKSIHVLQDFQIRYEDLLVDFENQAEKLFAYLDVEPDKEAYMNFDKHAQKRVVTTPSAAQVKQGIYQDAKYRWESYAKYMQPHWNIVKPFIDQFGYSVDVLEGTSKN